MAHPGGGRLQGHGAAAPPHRAHRRGPDTAEALKPYYRFLCKRPCSSDDYLPTFNRPNVTLVDVSESKGVERMTENGIVANGVEYEVDCIIFASGFEISTEISRRYAMDTIEGRDGLSLYDHWRDGYKTLHGMTSHGFPNQFFTGFTQGGVSANTTAMFEQQGKHIAYIISRRWSAARRPSSQARRAKTSGSRPSENLRSTTRPSKCLHSWLLQQRRRWRGRGHPLVPRRALLARLLRVRRLAEEWRDKGDLEGLVLGK